MEGAKKKKAVAMSFDDDDDFLTSWKPGKLGGLDLDESSKKSSLDADLDGGLGKDLSSLDDLEPKQASKSLNKISSKESDGLNKASKSLTRNKFSSKEPSFSDSLNTASKSPTGNKFSLKEPSFANGLNKTSKPPVENNFSVGEASFNDTLDEASKLPAKSKSSDPAEDLFADTLNKTTKSPVKNFWSEDSLADGFKKQHTSSSEVSLRSSPPPAKKSNQVVEIGDGDGAVHEKLDDEDHPGEDNLPDKTHEVRPEKIKSFPVLAKAKRIPAVNQPVTRALKKLPGTSSPVIQPQEAANKKMSNSGSKLSSLSTINIRETSVHHNINDKSSSSMLATRNTPAELRAAEKAPETSEIVAESSKLTSYKTPEVPQKSNLPSQENHGALTSYKIPEVPQKNNFPSQESHGALDERAVELTSLVVNDKPSCSTKPKGFPSDHGGPYVHMSRSFYRVKAFREIPPTHGFWKVYSFLRGEDIDIKIFDINDRFDVDEPVEELIFRAEGFIISEKSNYGSSGNVKCKCGWLGTQYHLGIHQIGVLLREPGNAKLKFIPVWGIADMKEYTTLLGLLDSVMIRTKHARAELLKEENQTLVSMATFESPGGFKPDSDIQIRAMDHENMLKLKAGYWSKKDNAGEHKKTSPRDRHRHRKEEPESRRHSLSPRDRGLKKKRGSSSERSGSGRSYKKTASRSGGKR